MCETECGPTSLSPTSGSKPKNLELQTKKTLHGSRKKSSKINKLKNARGTTYNPKNPKIHTEQPEIMRRKPLGTQRNTTESVHWEAYRKGLENNRPPVGA